MAATKKTTHDSIILPWKINAWIAAKILHSNEKITQDTCIADLVTNKEWGQSHAFAGAKKALSPIVIVHCNEQSWHAPAAAKTTGSTRHVMCAFEFVFFSFLCSYLCACHLYINVQYMYTLL